MDHKRLIVPGPAPEDLERNPTIVPKRESNAPHCPKCGCRDFGGRNIQGRIYYTCSNEDCGNRWEGAMWPVAQDPQKPIPPINPKDRPLVEQVFDPRSKEGFTEIRRRADPSQTFRKGALITEEE